MAEWLPASTRITHYQDKSARDAKRAREYRNGKKRVMNGIFAEAAAIDAAKGRTMLFDLISQKLPANYTGVLKMD